MDKPGQHLVASAAVVARLQRRVPMPSFHGCAGTMASAPGQRRCHRST
jgi:hypothetical protein